MSERPAFRPRDDRFHFADMSDRWWETETCWFSFFHPGRRLGGWVYVMVRPNIGTVAGGAWVWDDTAHLPWEVLYSANYTSLRLPPDQDLDDIVLPTGVAVRAVEPTRRYRVGYRDPGRLELDLAFDAVMPATPLSSTASAYGASSHFDQLGRVHGEMTLHGEQVEIDCIAMRDRSWGPRPEHRPRQVAYVTASTGPDHGFLAITDSASPDDPVTHGFLLRDGEVATIVDGHRSVERHPEHGWVTSVRLQATDARGRTCTATGRPLSRIVINRHTLIDCNTLLEWELDGIRGWGEDQDLWPMHTWAAAARARRGSPRGTL